MAKTDTAACIRLAMAKAQVSGRQLATWMMVTETTVSRWRDKGCDKITTLENIAHYCKMNYDELMALAD